MLKQLTKILFLASLFLGCEQKHFSHIYDKTQIGKEIRDLKIEHKDKKVELFFNKALKNNSIIQAQNSTYKLLTEFRLYGHKCNNPLATQEQKSYIGFVQITLFKENRRIYMCQSDFKNENEIEDIVEGLIEIMVDEMES